MLWENFAQLPMGKSLSSFFFNKKPFSGREEVGFWS